VTEGRLLAGRYRLEELLASGGMAQVWRSTDEVLQRRVAVKVLHPHLAADHTFVLRFRQEAVAAARLAHPGIVSIYDTCSDAGVEAIVMELVEGRTLRDRMTDGSPIEPWQAAGLCAQVAEALDAAHRTGLVHRDVKPANLLLCGDGRVKVADFGIAKAAEDADLTQPGAMVGTAKYLAPEQVRGDPVDARTDIYSLGIVLYELLCGRPPFAADTDAATALARITTDPLRPRQVRSGVPKALEDITLKAMAREPGQRYDSAADLRAALLAAGALPAPEPDLTGSVPVAAFDATAVTSSARVGAGGGGGAPSFVRSERSWLIPTTIVVIVALALGLAGLLLGRSGAGDLFGALGGDDDTPVTITSAQAFDPGGDGRENDLDAPLAIDGDPGTAWETEGYNDRDITKLKDGVGLVLVLDRSTTLEQLELDSPTNGWKVRVYVADQPAADLAGWGEPVATTDDGMASGTSVIDLGGAKGAAVLVWIIDRGDAPRRASAEIREARVLAG
jgi:tRNA A-37 threonylcarbamoyl transferase component Bud32